MNYRHIYHAGNFADVFKHLVMILAADYLQEKDKALLFMDAFAGCGLYDLNSSEAQRGGEYEAGIGRVMAATSLNPDIKRYQDLIRPFWQRHTYPGSPLLLANALRVQDRLIANELHPQDFETLKMTLGRFSSTYVMHMDAYECVRANIPPVERRGLFLVDPPFEKKNEFELLIRQMVEWKKRFSTGCYIIWYPIKAHLQMDDLHEAAEDLNINRSWVAEFLINPRDQEGTFNGCGLLMLNAPYSVPERVAAMAPELGALLNGRLETRFLSEGV